MKNDTKAGLVLLGFIAICFCAMLYGCYHVDKANGISWGLGL